MSPGSREFDKSHNRILLAKALRTTRRFGNGAEKVRKITVTKLNQAGRDGGTKKKARKKAEPDDPQQNGDERGSIQPLLKMTS
jgi:hypothetical protein